MKFRKLLAMVLAVAMIASLAPVLRTTAKAEATWTKVEWTWDKRSNSDIKAKIDFGSTGKKDVNLTYQGISYTAAAKLDSSGKITITVPDGGGDLLVAYGYDSTKTLPGVKVKKTIDNTEISGSGIKSTENASDNTYIFKASLAAGIWELQRENSGEPWVVYISLSPAGPGVSSEIDSDSLKLEKDESGNFSGSATATVTVSNYEGNGWEFKAISEDASKVKVTFAKATIDSDVNGTYTLTITPVENAETGVVNIYAGVVTRGKTPTKAEEFDKCATIPVTISQKTSTGGGGTGGSGTKKTVIYHKYDGTEAFSDEISEKDGKYTFQPLSPDSENHRDLITITFDNKTYTLLGWTRSDTFKNNSAFISKENSLNLYDYNKDKDGYELIDTTKFSTYGLISEYDVTAKNTGKNDGTPRTNAFKECEFPGDAGDTLDLYPIYVETVEKEYDVGVTAKGPGDVSVKVSRAGLPTTDPRWLGSVNVIIYKDGVIQNTDPEQQKMYFNYNSDNMVDIELELQDSAGTALTDPERSPYVINAVIAQQGGSGGSKGGDPDRGLNMESNILQPTKGLVDNVIGGTTVYVFMSTRYTAKFYLDGEEKEVAAFKDAEFSTDENLSVFDGLLLDSGSEIKGEFTRKYIVTEAKDKTKYTEVDFTEGTTDFLKDGVSGYYNDKGYSDTIVHGGKYLFGYFVKTYPHVFTVPATSTTTGKGISDLLNGDSWVLREAGGTQMRQEPGTFELNDTNIAYAPDGVFRFYANTFGKLTVSKKVEGDTADANQDFSFTVTFDNIPAGGALPESGTGYTIDGNEARFTLKAGGRVTIEKIPAKTTYTVAETSVAGFVASGTLTGTIPSGGTAEVEVINTYTVPKGGLTITKTVDGANAPENDEFEFTVQATGTAVENVKGKTFDKVTFGADGSATVKVSTKSGSGTITISGLPIGTYTVTEKNKDHYTPNQAPQTVTLDQDGETIAFSNTYNQPTGSLTITKEVKGTNAPTTWEFTFKVKAPSGVTFDRDADYGTGVTYDSSDGTLKVTLKNGATSITIENLPIGTYTVTEADVDGYELTAASGDDVTYSGGSSFTAAITEDGTTTAAVTNTFLTGDLTINKTVDGTNAPASDTFTFTVKAADDATKAKVAGKEFDSVHFDANGVSATVTITTASKAGSVIIENLPIGNYTVEETAKTHYTTKQPSQPVNVTTSGGTANFTNTYDQPTGNLTITKTVEGVASASGQVFTFTITAPSDKTVDGNSFTVTGATAGTITFSARTATVTVKMDAALTKTVTIAGLPTGYYKVEENTADLSDYNTTYAPDDAPSTGVNVTESGGEVTVTNTHKTGNLTIRKTVTGSGPAVPTNGTFTFTITAPDGLIAAGTSFNLEGAAGTVTFTDGKTAEVKITTASKEGSVTITGLPVGDYKVKETVPTGYASTDGEKTATVNDTGTPASVSFTNIYQTGTLTISKTVAGNTSAVGESFTFTITAVDEATKKQVGSKEIDGVKFNNGTAEVTIVMDGATTEKSIKGLPAGSYSVSEKTADNYTVKETEPQTVKITSNGGVERVSFTNTYDTGDLTITKNVTGGTNVKVSQTFTFTVKAPENLIKEGASFDVSNGTSAKFNGGVAEVTVTLSNSNTGSVTIEGLPVGDYEITEKDVPTGYTASRSENVTVAKDTTVTAPIINTLQTANLTVTKAPLKHDPNVDLPTDPTFTFAVAFTNFPAGVTSFECGTSKTVTTANNIVTFTLKENGSQILTGIPAGIGFEVTEAFQSDDLGRHFTTEWTHRTGTLNSSTTVTCTNTYHMLEKGNGALVIRKVAVGGQAGTVYQFKVTFTQGGRPYTGQIGGKTLGSDGSATFEMDDTINHVLVIQVPVGVTYKVEEVFASGERPKAISVGLEQNEAGDSTSGETASGTISQEFNYDSVIFTNSYLGDLTISKTVPQFDGGEEFTFTVTLPTGTYNYTGDKSGTISSGGTVTLKAGESITIQNLPAGSTYTVTEAGTANYKTESVDATGTIENNKTAEAKFTNIRNTGTLTVTKTLTGKLAASSDTFTFTVTLTGVGTGFNGDCGGVKFEDGVGTITITGAGSETITGLPVGAGFTVKEQDASGYVTTYNNDPANHDKAEGTISANPTTVTVNNDKPDTGTITITKVVKNAPAGSDKVFNFTITLYLDEDLTNVATDINGEHSGFNFTNGVAPFTLRNGQSIQGAGEVTVSEGRLFYKIEEETNSNYKTTSETTDTNGKANGRVVTGEFTQDSANTTVTFTNTYNYGDLTITKKVTDDSGASHANDKFTFTITKKGDSTPVQTVEITGANSQPVSLPAGEYIVTETAGMGDSVAYKVGTSGASAANAEVTITAGGTVTVTVTNTYYSGGGTGGTGGGGGTPSPDIDTSEHYGYIIGVTHTEVAPEQNITRAEIATILFRLLTDEARAANWSENSGFPDVKSGVWYNHAVAVLHKMGIILGDDNGNFNPDQNITRAEVAAMVVRFYEVAEGTVLNNRFTDVETTKWYAEAVLLADYYGLMQGDGDTFKPEDLLTRAEAMTVFNRLLGRKPHKDHLHKDMITWTDNTDKNKWYYAEVQEATNSHTCGNNVVIDGKTYETWSAITKMRDWAALEY